MSKSVFLMRAGGFGPFPKGGKPTPESHMSPPPPEDEPALISNWVSGEPWNATGYSVSFGDRGLSEQEMMDLEISYADSPATVRNKMEFPALPADPEGANLFRALSGLIKKTHDDPGLPDDKELLRGFSASVAAVINAYAPSHAAAIGSNGGEFVAGSKLAPVLRAFAGALDRTVSLNGEEPTLPAQEGEGAFFISPNRSINLSTLFDRAAFRSLMMGETVPRALSLAIFEARHSLDERAAGSRLSVQESWEAMMSSTEEFFLSSDREALGRSGADIISSRKPVREKITPSGEVDRSSRPDLWASEKYDDNDPASFGL